MPAAGLNTSISQGLFSSRILDPEIPASESREASSSSSNWRETKGAAFAAPRRIEKCWVPEPLIAIVAAEELVGLRRSADLPYGVPFFAPASLASRPTYSVGWNPEACESAHRWSDGCPSFSRDDPVEK